VFIIGPDKKIKAMLTYPMTNGRNFDEVLRLRRLDAGGQAMTSSSSLRFRMRRRGRSSRVAGNR
jgi:hypothetical protein